MMNSNANALVMKEINTNLVRRVLKVKKEATRHQIAEATGLSTVTVASILQKLIEENRVFDAGLVASMGGRPAQLFRFNDDHSHVLVLFTHEEKGLDVLYMRIANLAGKPVFEKEIPLNDIHLNTFEEFVELALEEHSSIRAIGFGLPGVELNGQVLGADYPALAGTQFIEHYQKRYQLPVIFENDVNAACVGYCKSHRIESEAATLYLYFPQKYPPGGGIYIDGKLYKGFSHFAGEIAGMPLDVDWLDPALYQSSERICAAISRVVTAINMLLNPHSIILYAAFLTEDYLHDIQQRCERYQPANSLATLQLADDFTLDYQNGMIEQTLMLLEPQPSISF